MRQSVNTKRECEKWKRRAFAGAILAFLAGGVSAGAQQAGNEMTNGAEQKGSLVNPADKKINVSAEEARLTDVVKTMMAQIGANYTIDLVLRGATITAHLSGVKFSTTLDVILRGATIPAEAIYENGIYRVRVRQEPEPPTAEVGTGGAEAELPPRFRIDHAFVNFLDAGLLARILNGTAFETTGNTYGFVPNSFFGPNFTFNANANGAGAANGQQTPSAGGVSSFYGRAEAVRSSSIAAVMMAAQTERFRRLSSARLPPVPARETVTAEMANNRPPPIQNSAAPPKTNERRIRKLYFQTD